MDQMNGGFVNPQVGDLGMGMAQNAGSMLNWRGAYQKYSMDMQEQGQPPMPMEQFVAQMAKQMQQSGGQPMPNQRMPNSGLLSRVGQMMR